MSTYRADHRLARPTPLHALRPGSLAAVERMRAAGSSHRVDRAVAALVRSHPRPEPVSGEAVGKVPAAAAGLASLAASRGFEVRTDHVGDLLVVSGLQAATRVGFKASWRNGRTIGASWHEPWRYELVRDDRPVGVNANTRTGLAGKRPAGVGRERLRLVGTPWGQGLNVTALADRLMGYDPDR